MTNYTTLTEAFDQIGARSSPALISWQPGNNAVVTHGDLRKLCTTINLQISKFNLAPDSTVGLVASHSLETAIALVGISTSGYPCSPLNPSLSRELIISALKDAGAKLILVRYLVFLYRNTIDHPAHQHPENKLLYILSMHLHRYPQSTKQIVTKL